jgi:hypothetical protein
MGPAVMSLEHWFLATMIMLGLGVNAWVGWLAYQAHQMQVILVLQGRTVKDVVDELHRMLLARGDAR